MRLIPAAMLPLLLAACAPTDVSNDNGEGNESAPSAAPEAAETSDGAPVESPQLERTAWRSIAGDGAVYTTFLDEGGLYRDFRNGDPWRDGSWGRNAAGRLCFTPADENLAGDCWTLKKPDKNGTMRASNGSSQSIRLQQVAYIAPADPEPAE